MKKFLEKLLQDIMGKPQDVTYVTRVTNVGETSKTVPGETPGGVLD